MMAVADDRNEFAITMITTLIYRSRALRRFSQSEVDQLAAKAFARNLTLHVTGVLVFDGEHFLQVLEGPADAVEAVFDRLSRDTRHDNLVTMLCTQAARRRFGSWGMYYARTQSPYSGGTRQWLPDYHHLHEDDRVAQVVEYFLQGQWKQKAFAHPISANEWSMHRIAFPMRDAPSPMPDEDYGFAFQPIVHAGTRAVSSTEALLRGPGGLSPQTVFARFQGDVDALYEFDLKSKSKAISLAVSHGCKTDLSINLLPRSLTHVRSSTDFLLEALTLGGLSPEQLVIEVTEEEAITDFEAFRSATQKLRAAGIRLAIDDFGAGHAGLSLLTEFQPDILKIDRCLINGIASNGPRQAIVAAIIDLCRPLGIVVIAEGIETMDEFDWLMKAGVQRFQGFLFARPAQSPFGSVHVPIQAITHPMSGPRP
jgi:blue light- and temperature-responsive anti-repressor